VPERTTGFLDEVSPRLQAIADEAAAGGLDRAIALMADCIVAGGVVQAFGTGHSQAFAMEIAGRAGGLIPTNAIRLVDLALDGERDPAELSGSAMERDASLSDDLLGLYPIRPQDVFIIASNSGVNGSIVGTALAAKAAGHPVIAVTSMQHTMAVTPKHPSGQRLSDVADVVIDNRAPFGDTTIELGSGVKVGAVSSITAAFIAQLLTIGVAQRLGTDGTVPPVYISANIPGGDEHNSTLEAAYGNRIKRGAAPGLDNPWKVGQQ
jgi:uncharacterized phosphosugar-binding protein